MQWLWLSGINGAFCEENIVQFGVTESLTCSAAACPINFEASESIAAASALRIGRLRTACELPVSSNRRIATEWPKVTK